MVAEIFALQAFVGGVFAGCEPEGSLGDFGGEDGVFEFLPEAAFLPFVGQFVTDGDAAHALLDPRVGVTFGEVEGASALGGEFGIFDFLHAFIADFSEPAFEGLGLGTGDGLDQAENAFGMPADEFLRATGRGELQSKGGGKLPPPFEAVGQGGGQVVPPLECLGEGGVAATHILEVACRVGGVGERGDDVDDDEPPLVGVEGFADFLFLEEGDSGFHGTNGAGQRCAWEKSASVKRGFLSRRARRLGA